MMLASELRAKAARAVIDGWQWQAGREYHRVLSSLHAAAIAGGQRIRHQLTTDYSAPVYPLVRDEVCRRLRENDGCEVKTYRHNGLIIISFYPPPVSLAVRLKRWWNS